jgi:hypothetical protein
VDHKGNILEPRTQVSGDDARKQQPLIANLVGYKLVKLATLFSLQNLIFTSIDLRSRFVSGYGRSKWVEDAGAASR